MDCWPMARTLRSDRGQPRPADTAMVDAGRRVLLLGRLGHSTPPGEVAAADGCPGELRGEKRIALRGSGGSAAGAASGRVSGHHPPILNLSGASRGAGGRPRRTIVIWLILPVVICLSQRLSHACLSISNYTAKLRMAHYISYRLFDSTLLLG